MKWDQVLRNPLEETITDTSNLKLKVDWQYNGARRADRALRGEIRR